MKFNPATSAGATFCRATLPRPGATRSSLLAARSTGVLAACGERPSSPSAGSRSARLATVSRNWPSRRPRRRKAERAIRRGDGLALLHPRLGDFDASAGRLDLAEAIRPRLRREILEPAQHRRDVGVERPLRHRMQRRRRRRHELERDLNHRIVRAEPSSMRPSSSRRAALNSRCVCPSQCGPPPADRTRWSLAPAWPARPRNCAAHAASSR